MAIKRAHVYISGRVQGVFFRAWTADQARRLGLNGWVRNRLDGRVEAVFEGAADDVVRMVDLCHEGPAHARVETVISNDSEPAEGLTGFEVRSTV
jgi:acylphosphatase